METENRFISIMTLHFSNKILKLEEQLEKTINSDLEINEKVKTIDKLLGKLIKTEHSFLKFKSLISNDGSDNNKK